MVSHGAIEPFSHFCFYTLSAVNTYVKDRNGPQ